jgi:hypothetical protein
MDARKVDIGESKTPAQPLPSKNLGTCRRGRHDEEGLEEVCASPKWHIKEKIYFR